MPTPLDADQLRTFVAIVDAGSFTRAAGAVHRTQSAVSMQVKRLEERLGVALFQRDGRGARLTEQGDRLLDYARRIVKLNLEALSALGEPELEGGVRLGIPDDYAERYLPSILARFAADNPRVELSVACEPTPLLRERIARGELDLAIITHVEARGPSEIVHREPLLWVSSARHAIHEASPLPLALGNPSCDWRASAVEALERRGRAYLVRYTSWSSAAVAAAVMAGLAVAVLPESAVRSGMRVLTPAEGFPPLPSVKIGLLRARGEASPLLDRVAEHVTQCLAALGGAPALLAAE